MLNQLMKILPQSLPSEENILQGLTIRPRLAVLHEIIYSAYLELEVSRDFFDNAK